MRLLVRLNIGYVLVVTTIFSACLLQAMFGMNRLDAALVHLHAALRELGVSQPSTRMQVSLRIYWELAHKRLREMHPNVFLRRTK